MAFLTDHQIANAGQALRQEGVKYKKWTEPETRIIEVRALLGDTIAQIEQRLRRDGYCRSAHSITVMLRKLGVGAKDGRVVVPFAK